MLLRAMPAEVLAVDPAQIEAAGESATEVGLPMANVLNQLPSGKVEVTIQELADSLPAGYLKPAESIAGLMGAAVTLPLMDVVMRIPPDLLALRPDQKDVDATVIKMAAPFTEESLRAGGTAARAGGSQANIIDEHQVPVTEEFVPRDQAPSPKSFVPPPRPLAGSSIAKTGAVGYPSAPPLTATPLPAGARTAAIPPLPPVVRNSSPVPPPAPNSTSRRISPSGRLPAPFRAGSPMPMRPQGALTTPVSLPQTPAPEPRVAPMAPPLPGSTARTAPLPILGRAPQTPQPPLRPTMSVPTVPPPVPVAATPMADSPAPAASPVAGIMPGQPDAAADELQRLAALAMQEEAPLADTAETSDGDAAVAATEPLVTATAAVPQPPPPTSGVDKPFPAAIRQTSSIPRPPMPAAMTVPLGGRPKAEPEVPAAQPAAGEAPATALNLNSCGTQDLIQIPGCSAALADAIVRHRARIGSFKRLEDLLDVPGMNSSAYRNLTGEAPPQSGIPQSLSELLGFPEDQKITLKDVTDRISCWPDVTGCLLGQSAGLPLVGNVPKNLDKAAIVAFAPRMFESINKSFGEIAGKETNELIIPTTGTSFHIFRNGDLYLIILCRLPQMPDRHVKIARLVLSGLSQIPA